jgi:alpha-beta hydrolase superfamily lysophospholipase
MTQPDRHAMSFAWLMRMLCLLLVLGFAGCSNLTPRIARPSLGEQTWTSFDGKAMPCQKWLPPADVRLRGAVIAVHGLSGASSDFWFLGAGLPARGYAVYAYDLRGQGNDPVADERGDIRSSGQWLDDLETFHGLVRRRHPGTPVFWYGESLGSLICLHTAANRLPDRRDPDGIILASPVAGLRMTVSHFRRWLLQTTASLAPKTRFTLGDLAGIDETKLQVTSKTTHGGQMQQTPHHVGSFTVRLLAEVGRLLDDNPKAARRLRMPVLFLASPNDILSSPDQIQSLFAQVRSPRKKLLWYSRSHHLLLHDVQRSEVSHDLLRWIESLRAKLRQRS